MEKILLTKEIEKEHLEFFKSSVIKNCQKQLENTKETSKYPKNHINFLSLCIRYKHILAIGKPEILLRCSKKIEEECKDVFDEIKANKDYRKKIISIFAYKTFSDGNPSDHVQGLTVTEENKSAIDHFKWCAYKFLLFTGLTVCPYCNRQHITTVYTDENGKARGHIDHYFPKSKYPHLSLSLYNLVPSCSTCNSSLKRDSDELDVMLNPYVQNIGDLFQFELNLLPPSKHQINICPTKGNKATAHEHITRFKLEPLYQYHQDDTVKMLRKRELYSDSYLNEVLERHTALFTSEEDLKELIFNYSSLSMNTNKDLLGKLRRDIAKQLKIL